MKYKIMSAVVAAVLITTLFYFSGALFAPPSPSASPSSNVSPKMSAEDSSEILFKRGSTDSTFTRSRFNSTACDVHSMNAGGPESNLREEQ